MIVEAQDDFVAPPRSACEPPNHQQQAVESGALVGMREAGDTRGVRWIGDQNWISANCGKGSAAAMSAVDRCCTKELKIGRARYNAVHTNRIRESHGSRSSLETSRTA